MLDRFRRSKHWLGIAAAVLLGLIFVIAGTGKLGPQPTAAYQTILGMRLAIVPTAILSHIDTWLPRIEVALGVVIIMGVAIRVTSLISLALIIGFTFNNAWLISQGLGESPCGCFGETPLLGNLSTGQSLYLDIGMMALVSAIWFTWPGKISTVRPWFWKEGAGDAKDRAGSG